MTLDRVFTTLRGALALGFCYHAAAVAVSGLLPAESALAERARPVFATYLRVTGNMNDWAMFTDRPAFRRFDVTAVAEFPDGSTRRYGPVLPGLEPYDGSMRALKLFVKLGQNSENRALAKYLAALEQAILERDGVRPRAVALEFDTEVFQSHAEVTKTGVLTEKRTYRRALR
jgi:hypothetical protein